MPDEAGPAVETQPAAGAGGTMPTEEEKDRMYAEEMADIATQMQQIEEGTHPELREAEPFFEQERQFLLNCGKSQKDQHMAMLKKYSKDEEKILTAEYKKDKVEARKAMIAALTAERDECNAWFNGARIESASAADRDTRQTRKTRAARADSGTTADAQVVLPAGVKVPSAVADEKGKRKLSLIHMALDSADVDQDFRHFQSVKSHKAGAGMGAKGAKQPPQELVEVYYEHTVLADLREFGDRLYYVDKWFYRGNKVTIEWPGAPTKVTGVVFMFTPTHLWLRRTDTQKYCLALDELMRGVATLRVALGREQ